MHYLRIQQHEHIYAHQQAFVNQYAFVIHSNVSDVWLQVTLPFLCIIVICIMTMDNTPHTVITHEPQRKAAWMMVMVHLVYLWCVLLPRKPLEFHSLVSEASLDILDKGNFTFITLFGITYDSVN